MDLNTQRFFSPQYFFFFHFWGFFLFLKGYTIYPTRLQARSLGDGRIVYRKRRFSRAVSRLSCCECVAMVTECSSVKRSQETRTNTVLLSPPYHLGLDVTCLAWLFGEFENVSGQCLRWRHSATSLLQSGMDENTEVQFNFGWKVVKVLLNHSALA